MDGERLFRERLLDGSRIPTCIILVHEGVHHGLAGTDNILVTALEERYSSRVAAVGKSCRWTVAGQAHEGDLVLFYHSTPRREIGDVFRVAGPVEVDRPRKGGFAWNSRGREWFAELERVARLRSPVTLMHLKAHPALRDAGWLRNNLVARARVTVDWMFLRELIVERNASMQRVLPPAQGQGY